MSFPPQYRPSRLLGWTSFVCYLSLFATPNTVFGAPIDEFRISDIEQKIRDLETTTREQARLIAQLLGQAGNSRSTSTPTATDRVPASNELRWLSASNWTRIESGMSELQIIELLGVPTQVRSSDNGQTRSLLYALEIGRSGFLSGKVELQGGKTIKIEIPHLR